MATRSETQRKKTELRQWLLNACRSGELTIGQVLPPIRQLSRAHGLSLTLASDVIRDLVVEGVLYTQPGAGTFVGRPANSRSALYLIVLPHDPLAGSHLMAAMVGFEERIAQRGGRSICLDYASACEWLEQGRMPALAGVFDLFEMPRPPLSVEADVAHVLFGDHPSSASTVDRVLFDDFDGGRQATHHLLRQGHRRIGFVGLHERKNPAAAMLWSFHREAGWRSAMESEDCWSPDLASHPDIPYRDGQDWQSQAAFPASLPLVHRTDITAIVAVNRQVAQGFFRALREEGLSRLQWPAIIAFDDLMPEDRGSDLSFVTTLRLPWDDVGREAADLAWTRASGAEVGPGRCSQLRMRLIPRLSCIRSWAAETDFAGVK